MTQLAQKLQNAGFNISPEVQVILEKRHQNKIRTCAEGTMYRTKRFLGNVNCPLREIVDSLKEDIVEINEIGPARVGYKQMPQGKLNVTITGDEAFLRKIRWNYEIKAEATVTIKVITTDGVSRWFYNLDLKTLAAKAKVTKRLVVSKAKKPKKVLGCDNPYQGGSIYVA